jgi:hypothetical protein
VALRPSTRSLLARLLGLLILVELGAAAGMGWVLRAPCPMAQADPMLDASSACGGHAVVQPRHVKAVNLEVRAWSHAYLEAHGVGARLLPVLQSSGDQFLVRYNLNRAHLLANPSDQQEMLEHLATQRVKQLTGVAQLLAPDLARQYELEFFATWDRAWMRQQAQLDPQDSIGALVEHVPSPLGGR